MIYDVASNTLHEAYDSDGEEVTSAFDVNGDQAYWKSGFPLKVMTYNVGQWYKGTSTNVPADLDQAYYALQSGMIERNNPDILAIQEYWTLFSQTGRTSLSVLEEYFPYIYEVGVSSGFYGRCICSKYPISNYTTHNYVSDSARYYDSCTITVDETPITVLTTHLSLQEENRVSEISELIEYLDTQTRFICCGDYNTNIMSESVTDPYYPTNVEPFFEAGFHSANYAKNGFLATSNNGVDGKGINSYIDNIYTSSNIDVINAYVDRTKITDDISEIVDHMPLIANLWIN